jgi:hypothetical protein
MIFISLASGGCDYRCVGFDIEVLQLIDLLKDNYIEWDDIFHRVNVEIYDIVITPDVGLHVTMESFINSLKDKKVHERLVKYQETAFLDKLEELGVNPWE